MILFSYLTSQFAVLNEGQKRASRWARTNPAPWCGEGSQHGKSAGTSSLLPGGSVGVVLSWFWISLQSCRWFFQPVMRCWCRFQSKLTSIVLIFTSFVNKFKLAAWLLKPSEACITMSLQLHHRVEPVGRRAGGHVWVGHWYSTRWVLMQWKERGGGKAWPKTSGCNHKIYGYPWKSRWCKVWKSCSGFMVVQECSIRMLGGNISGLGAHWRLGMLIPI